MVIQPLTTKEIQSALNYNPRDWSLRDIPTRDLVDRLEAWQYTRLDDIEHQGTREYCELQIDEIRAELTRRRKLLARASSGDPYAPTWPTKEERDQRLRERIEAVKERWPIDQFVEQVMFAELKPVGRGEFICNCPFPDHQDDSPSFRVYPNGSAWCFGCRRGGDIIRLAELYFRTTRFVDTLETLEALGSTGRVA